MTIYLVRHGETSHNAQGLHQDGKAKLSDLGIKQAQALAKRFSSIEVNQIIASPFDRTKQTAEMISSRINKPIEFSELLVEIKRPTEIENKAWDDEEARRVKDILKEHSKEANWHYSDEENFSDFKNRGLKILGHLKLQDKDNILIVTHGHVIGMVVALMLYGEEMTQEEYLRLQYFLSMTNTGITVCEFKNGYWRLVTWNDIAHLG